MSYINCKSPKTIEGADCEKNCEAKTTTKTSPGVFSIPSFVNVLRGTKLGLLTDGDGERSLEHWRKSPIFSVNSFTDIKRYCGSCIQERASTNQKFRSFSTYSTIFSLFCGYNEEKAHLIFQEGVTRRDQISKNQLF